MFQMDERMDEWINVQRDIHLDISMDGRMVDAWMEVCRDEWMMR